jgi:integrase
MFSGNLKDASLTTLPFGTNKAGKPVEREHSDGGGLYLVVGPTGTLRTGNTSTRRWIFKFQWQGKLTRMGLGTLEMIPVQEARRQAFENRKLVHAGKNPITEREAAATKTDAAPTFRQFVLKMRPKVTHGQCDKSVARWDRGMNVYAKPLHDLKVAAITRQDIIACLEPIWLDIPVGAKKFQSHLFDLFERADAAELMPQNARNPADFSILKRLMEKQPDAEESHRALPYAELPIAWQRMIEVDTVASWTAQFIFLTLARTGEALQARKSDINLETGEWNIPGKIMKNGKPANVPLSSQARALVCKALAWHAEMGIESEYLFPGSDRRSHLEVKKTQSENTVLFFLQKQLKLDTTTHGIRGTFRSWGGDQDGIEREVLEHCLHHILGDTAELAYNKADQWAKRFVVLQRWADYVSGTAPGGLRRRPDLKVVAA